ncbi:phosphomannomutase/phosphoglucomutase [Altericroceibacterium xinjiangense]|uniref:phosphomannomutase/phosphoglucomutase n=1 Tax=Altericroceibacterium xinjiangense TaxID=762261 RepID=UPI000F7F298D|nr:phosphomannomutase/phosphoglucomutase [Altericroceibacterium xinjiangense]
MAEPAINPKLRRSYDLRGVVGTTLTVDDARAVGRAFAALAREKGARRIAVSRDGRLSSPELEGALIAALLQGGMEISHLPPGPTPLLSFAIRTLGLDGGVMVTGSHNPADQNGFKFHLSGHPVHGQALGALWTIDPAEAPGGHLEPVDASEAYLDALCAELEGIALPPAAWDSGNGATGDIVSRLTKRLGPGQHALCARIDGHFPHHHPDPSVPENMAMLRHKVIEEQLDLGFAFDGDGDRIGVVDGSGHIVWADQLMLLLARDTLRDHPGSTIIADVKSSDVLFDGIAQAGGKPVMAPSGYVLIRDRMLAERSPFSGEMSGHIFFGDRWHHADDAIYNAVRTLRALARSGETLEQFREGLPQRFATPEMRFACPATRKEAVLSAIGQRHTAADRTDGLRVRVPGGWWLLRNAGTEDKLAARCEADSPEALDRIVSELARELHREGLSPDLDRAA